MEAETAAKDAAASPLTEKRDTGRDSEEVSDRDLLEAIPPNSKNQTKSSKAPTIYFQISEALQAGLRAQNVANNHLKWLRGRNNEGLVGSQTIPPHLGVLRVSPPSCLAIEYHGNMGENEEMKGRKRLNSYKEGDSEGNQNCEQDLLVKMYEIDTLSSNTESVRAASTEAKKLRLEEELWEEALKTTDVLQAPMIPSQNEADRKGSVVPGGSTLREGASFSSKKRGKKKASKQKH